MPAFGAAVAETESASKRPDGTLAGRRGVGKAGCVKGVGATTAYS